MLLSISPKRIPPCFHGPLTEEEMREDPGPEQVGLGYRAVSAVGGDRGRARTVHSWVWYSRGLLGTSSIFEICLSRSITICSSNGPLWSLYWSYSYCAPCEHVWIREGNRSDVPLTQPGNGPEGTAAWGMSASRRKAHFEFWVIGRAVQSGAQGSWYYPGAKNPGGDCNEQKCHSPA